MGLIDIDYFRQQPLGNKAISGMQSDVLQEAIDEASQYVEDYLDIKVLETRYIERIVGTGRFTLILDSYPITDLVGVSYDGYYQDTPGTHSTGDFLVHSEAGMIEWINKMYNFRTDRIYTVEYDAGYATVPGPIKRATALQTVQILRPMYGGATQGGDVDVVPFADEMIVNLLERYRRKRIS